MATSKPVMQLADESAKAPHALSAGNHIFWSLKCTYFYILTVKKGKEMPPHSHHGVLNSSKIVCPF